MQTPAAALAWELWRRHRLRLIALTGLFLGFALLYPILCASAGFNPASLDPLGEITKIAPGLGSGEPTASLCFELLFFFFLICSPWLALIASLLFVMWMFTLIELDPKTKALTFPGRLFTLPISTPFLSWSLVLSGMASIVVLYAGWTYFVRLPHMEMFETYRSCLGWMTMLALALGIVWTLDGWPNTRMVLLAAVFFYFLSSPVQRQVFHSLWVSPPLLFLGVALARVGLQKMRHGQWQGWPAAMPLMATRTRTEIKRSRRFASPAQAQLWFEWRRTSRSMCFYVAGLTIAPVAISLGMRFVFGRPWQDHDLSAFACYLTGVPLFIHSSFAISPTKTGPFLMNRPLTNGEMMMPKLKAAAISTVVSWGFVLAGLCVMPWLGNFSRVLRSASVPLEGWVVIAIGLIFLTWRFTPANLALVWSGHRWLAKFPAWISLAIPLAGGMLLAALAEHEAFWNSFCHLLPFLLAGLVALKFLLAVAAFRLSLKRRLLSQSALAAYLLVWFLIVAVLLGLLKVMVSLFPPNQLAIVPLALGIVLLVPLARIGFCPIALSWNRHA